MPSDDPEPRRLDLRDFLSVGPCCQRPGVPMRSGSAITTCPECHGLMIVGECAREKLRTTLDARESQDGV